MNQFESLSVDAKVVYLLILSDLIIDNISNSEGYKVAVESLEKCWEWLNNKNIKAYNLYLYLENMDEIDVMTYMQIEKDIYRERVWICIGNALAYTIWEAYQYEKEKFLPQTIESVDYETIESFTTNFSQVYADNSLADKLLRYLEINYPKGIDKQIDINSIKTFINEIVGKQNLINQYFTSYQASELIHSGLNGGIFSVEASSFCPSQTLEIASQFLGSGDIDNMVAMNRQVNRSGGSWYAMEKEWANALDGKGDYEGEKQEVFVRITAQYDDSNGVTKRPKSFGGSYRIGNDRYDIDIDNAYGG